MALDRHIMRNMAVLQQKYKDLFNSKLNTFGLNSKMYDFLKVICFRENVTQVELMEILRIDKAAVTRGLARLEEKKLIYRVKDTTDSRKYRLIPTETGKSLCQKVHCAYHRVAGVVLHGLDEKTLYVIEHSLKQIEYNIANFENIVGELDDKKS